jgi:hypothetical protein
VKSAPLVNVRGELMPNAYDIFNNWFEMYSEEIEGVKTMTEDTFINFMKDTTVNSMLDIAKLKSSMQQFNQDPNGTIVTHAQFLEFYRSKSVDKTHIVRMNLQSH